VVRRDNKRREKGQKTKKREKSLRRQ